MVRLSSAVGLFLAILWLVGLVQAVIENFFAVDVVLVAWLLSVAAGALVERLLAVETRLRLGLSIVWRAVGVAFLENLVTDLRRVFGIVILSLPEIVEALVEDSFAVLFVDGWLGLIWISWVPWVSWLAPLIAKGAVALAGKEAALKTCGAVSGRVAAIFYGLGACLKASRAVQTLWWGGWSLTGIRARDDRVAADF